jgi:tetrahydromethanopterin S-methyltransferase subunit G
MKTFIKACGAVALCIALVWFGYLMGRASMKERLEEVSRKVDFTPVLDRLDDIDSKVARIEKKVAEKLGRVDILVYPPLENVGVFKVTTPPVLAVAE